MVIAAVACWVIRVTVSYLLGFTFRLGNVGVWLGLAVGLAVAGVLLLQRFITWRAL